MCSGVETVKDVPVDENVDKFREMVEAYRHVSIQSIAQELHKVDFAVCLVELEEYNLL